MTESTHYRRKSTQDAIWSPAGNGGVLRVSSGFSSSSSPPRNRRRIDALITLDRGCAEWHAPRALAYMRSVTAIRTLARYAPLRLRAANSLASLSNLPLSPPASIQNLFDAESTRIGARSKTRSFQFPRNGVTGACRASSPATPDPAP